MSTPRVFVVQNQHRWDARTERLVEKYDLSPAREFGELVYLLGPKAAPFRPDTVVPELKEKLETFGDEDFLLLIGNPVLIGLASILAAEANEGSLTMLQWSGKDQKYMPIKIEGLFGL